MDIHSSLSTSYTIARCSLRKAPLPCGGLPVLYCRLRGIRLSESVGGDAYVARCRRWTLVPGGASHALPMTIHQRLSSVQAADSLAASNKAPPFTLCITHTSRCVRPGYKRSPWQLPMAQASSLRGGILSTAVRCWLWPLVRRHEPGITKTFTHRYRIHAGPTR